ncbi:MAG: hypothetical protein IJR07_04990 [Bacteroidaceae bacterium]|nr:hypothetical protein [Bacteroidaceae bacterium]
MNKRILLTMAAAAVVFATTSCSSEDAPMDTSSDTREVLATSIENSIETQAFLTDYLRLEYAQYYAEPGTRSANPSDYAEETDEMFQDYDLSTQYAVTSDSKDGTAYFIQNTVAENEFLAFYRDNDGNILSIKKISIQNEGDYSTVSFTRIDDSEFISAKGNMQQNSIEYLSYDESVFGMATTRNGCSFCLGLASLPWSAGFGMAHPLAGVAVSVAFLLLSEAIC